MTLAHLLINLLSNCSHMDFIRRANLLKTSLVVLNWSYWTLTGAIDLWISWTMELLDVLSLFQKVTRHSIFLINGNTRPKPNFRLDWLTVFSVQFTGILGHILTQRDLILSVLFLTQVLYILVTVTYQLIFERVHC